MFQYYSRIVLLIDAQLLEIDHLSQSAILAGSVFKLAVLFFVLLVAGYRCAGLVSSKQVESSAISGAILGLVVAIMSGNSAISLTAATFGRPFRSGQVFLCLLVLGTAISTLGGWLAVRRQARQLLNDHN